MTENMKSFVEQIEKDAALKAEIEAISKEYGEDSERMLGAKEAITQKSIAIAAKHGFTLTAEDFKQEAGELTTDQLDAVTGGGEGEYLRVCFCIVAGFGNSFKDSSAVCVCIAGGYGGSDDGSGTAIPRCICPGAGVGWDNEI